MGKLIFGGQVMTDAHSKNVVGIDGLTVFYRNPVYNPTQIDAPEDTQVGTWKQICGNTEGSFEVSVSMVDD